MSFGVTHILTEALNKMKVTVMAQVTIMPLSYSARLKAREEARDIDEGTTRLYYIMMAHYRLSNDNITPVDVATLYDMARKRSIQENGGIITHGMESLTQLRKDLLPQNEALTDQEKDKLLLESEKKMNDIYNFGDKQWDYRDLSEIDSNSSTPDVSPTSSNEE